MSGSHDGGEEPFETVKLHVYDVSQGMALKFSKPLLGKHIPGIWHTGIVAYGKVPALRIVAPASTSNDVQIQPTDLTVIHQCLGLQPDQTTLICQATRACRDFTVALPCSAVTVPILPVAGSLPKP